MSLTHEKLAQQLALLAAHRRRQVLQTKQAAGDWLNSSAGRYAIGGLGGAGIGALIGAMQPRNKKKNSLYYGALGGLGGLGLAAALAQRNNQDADAGSSSSSADKKDGGPADKKDGGPADKKDDSAATSLPPEPSVATHIPAALTTPLNPDEPLPRTNELAADVPIMFADVARKLPGVGASSPAVQFGGGLAGLELGRRLSSRFRTENIFGQGPIGFGAQRLRDSAARGNAAAVATETAYGQRRLDAANQRMQRELAAVPQVRLRGGGRGPDPLAVAAIRARHAPDIDRVSLDNAARLRQLEGPAGWRTWRARTLWPQLIRAATMAGGAWAGSASPSIYGSVNDLYRASRAGQ